MSLRIALEPWSSFCSEAEPLMREHHQEVGTHGVPFDLDHERIRQVEAVGNVAFWVAREQGCVVGYVVWYLGWHLFSRGLRVAQQGPWYVTPQRRKSSIAVRLWSQSLKELKAAGFDLALPHHQFAGGFELDEMFKRRGAEAYEMSYLLWLKKPNQREPNR